MNGSTKIAGRTTETVAGNPLQTAQRALLGLFLIAIGFSIAQTFFLFRLPLTPAVSDALVLLLALATTLVSLAGQLPAQNVLLATVVIALIGGGIHAIGAFTGIPFGPVIYTPENGPRLFNALPWFMPFLWVIVILNARGVARLILRPWRKLRVYGFWLIGTTGFGTTPSFPWTGLERR
jgi:uncharacterized membrane protein